MTWLTWRQFRDQILIALGLVVAAAGYLLYLGYRIRDSYDTDILGCLPADGCDRSDAVDQFLREHTALVIAPSIVLIVLPAIIGIFWGAPLIARELETNTHRLAWNQSITRTRWLAVKLAVVGGTSIVIVGVLSLLLTWAASRYDQLQGTRFETISFASRNIAPLGYAAFTLVLGTAIGLFLRRAVPAMAVTLLLVSVIQIALPILSRPHLDPVTKSVAYNSEARAHDAILGLSNNDPVVVMGYTVPGALMATSSTDLLTASGKQIYPADVRDCLPAVGQGTRSGAQVGECLAKKGLRFEATYQPAGRYWPFQWAEFGGYFALALVFAGATFWRIRHVTG